MASDKESLPTAAAAAPGRPDEETPRYETIKEYNGSLLMFYRVDLPLDAYVRRNEAKQIVGLKHNDAEFEYEIDLFSRKPYYVTRTKKRCLRMANPYEVAREDGYCRLPISQEMRYRLQLDEHYFDPLSLQDYYFMAKRCGWEAVPEEDLMCFNPKQVKKAGFEEYL